MKKMAILCAPICALAIAPINLHAHYLTDEQAGAEAEQEDVVGKEDYESFMVCAAYVLAHAKSQGKSKAEAAPAFEKSETLLFAAYLADPDKAEGEGEKELIDTANELVRDMENGDEQTKKDIAGLGEACKKLYPLAVEMTEQAEELTNAT